MVHMTMAEDFRVFSAASITFFQVSLRWRLVRIIAPAAPTPAASVGAAIPVKMVPRTRKMRMAGAIIRTKSFNLLARGNLSSFGTGGPSFGFI